mmetsp:Transcript_38357/g.102094  ORF Transcript_38357/g.102094 Transcript_38357/m.102094 type:complete len:284 (+) Transcript_38357:790-1641(+)
MEVEHEKTTSAHQRDHLGCLILNRDGRQRGLPTQGCCSSVQEGFKHLEMFVLEINGVGQPEGNETIRTEVIRQAWNVHGTRVPELVAHPGQRRARHRDREQTQHLQQTYASVHQMVRLHDAHHAKMRSEKNGAQRDASVAASPMWRTVQAQLLEVNGCRLARDPLPTELAQSFLLRLTTHPPSVIKVLAYLTYSPSNAARIWIHEITIATGMHEVSRPTVCRSNHGLPRSPGFKNDDAKGLVPAWHHHRVAGLEKRLEVRSATLNRAREAYNVSQTKLTSTGL